MLLSVRWAASSPGGRAVTADTNLRLARAFGASEGFWLGLQGDYDLEEKRNEIDKKLNQIKPINAAA